MHFCVLATVLNNATNARYTHTLNVSGTELSAPYGCFVSNNKPSSAKVIVIIGDNGMNSLYSI